MPRLVSAIAVAVLLCQPVCGADPAADAGVVHRPAFEKLDTDSSNGLSLAEHLANVPVDQRPQAKQQFLVMDADANGDLTFAEYLALVGVDVPDPWVELATAAFQTYQNLAADADKNGDGTLSRAEWPKEAITAKLLGFGTKTFSQWDANQDGQVSADEARRMLDIGYAVCLPTGEPARWPTGTILYWSHLRDVDKNRDFAVSKAEFIAKHWLGKEKNEAVFPELDQDGDKQLTYAEIQKLEPFLVNLVSMFYAFDTDLDGKLSPAELAEKCPPAQKNPRGLELGMAAFDADRDGKYSFREFRLSPLGGLHVTVSLLNLKDSNQDSTISFKEFSAKSSPLFAGIAGEVFRRYDQDHDGQLTTDEYDFPEDDELKQLAQQFAPQMRSILAAELNFFLTICPVTAEQRTALKPQVRRMMDKSLRQVAIGQKQMNRGFNSNNPPTMPDPQLVFSAQLLLFAGEHLSPEQTAAYQQEIDRRAAQRQQATVKILVARLDRDLLLSGEQREKVEAALLAKWQSSWAQQVEYLLQNDQQMLALPDGCIVPHLTDLQKTVWQAIPKSASFGWNFGGVFQAVNVANDGGGPVGDLLPALDGEEQMLDVNQLDGGDFEN